MFNLDLQEMRRQHRNVLLVVLLLCIYNFLFLELATFFPFQNLTRQLLQSFAGYKIVRLSIGKQSTPFKNLISLKLLERAAGKPLVSYTTFYFPCGQVLISLGRGGGLAMQSLFVSTIRSREFAVIEFEALTLHKNKN